MKIAMIVSEANPFIKTGGLADVSYGLSKELASLGEKVVLFLPLYSKIREKVIAEAEPVVSFEITMSWRKEGTTIYHLPVDGIDYYFVENRHYFERDNVYSYFDDGERFAFYDLACIEALELLEFQPDIIHVHDWQTAMVPCIIKEKHLPFFKDTKYVFTIHNPAFLGYLDRSALGDLFALPDELFDNGKVRFNNMVSMFKAGLVYSDKIVAVSPTHHLELLSSESGMGLEGVLTYREFDFSGILNGLDYNEFNPETDHYIAYPFNINNFISSKKKNKKDLCDKLGIKMMEGPMYSLVSRVTWQKGMDLVMASCYKLAEKGCNIVLLGSGEAKYEDAMRKLQANYPDRVAVYVGYSNALAHQIYASSDFFLMPSLFEPCGLGQMIAQRYGTLPIVRRVGGLKDSVIPYDGSNEKVADGFGFDGYFQELMDYTCDQAYGVYQNKELYHQLVKNAMKVDHSWKASGKEYLQLYQQLLK